MHGPTTGVVQLIVYMLAGFVAPAAICNVIGWHVDLLVWSSVIVVDVMPPPFGAVPQLPPARFVATWRFIPPVASRENASGVRRTFWFDVISIPFWAGAVARVPLAALSSNMKSYVPGASPGLCPISEEHRNGSVSPPWNARVCARTVTVWAPT